MISLCFPRFTTNLNDEEIKKKLEKLHLYCSTPMLDSQLSEPKKDKELKLFSEIIHKASCSQLLSQDFNVLVNCAIKILSKYSRYHIPDIEVSGKKQNSIYQVAKDNFVKLLSIYPKEKLDDVAKIVLTIIDNQNFWPTRKLCAEIIICLIDLGISGSLVYHELCDKIEFPNVSTDVDIKLVVKVLYESLENYKWPEDEETVIFLKRLLNMFNKSLKSASKKTKDMAYTNLRACLELSVRYLIRNIANNHRMVAIEYMSSWAIKKDMYDDFILNYGSTLEYAAYMHQGTSLTDTLNADILSMLMLMIGSNIRFVSLLGNRIFQYLIDSNKNQMLFNNPKIFFQGMHLSMKPCKYNREDKQLLKKHREIIHESLIRSFVNHKSTRLNVETTYCTVCLLIVAIPCGFTAAAICCLMMNLQDIVLNKLEKTERKELYHLHAIIISVITFICWIEEAEHFHEYMNKIVMERAQWAPHLNPPLQSYYNFASHHLLWDKPELFPIDWEVRYGLWKRFRLNISTKTKKVLYVVDK
ncbi:uncharacterized protein LOC131665289 [Phymastichus coffea]|uniref:uncharacterized protein LOC131665289 n=1 Tax=Phymastichus coffea TaxID=108790 RepID=UPI00273AE77D|nr:uncharacterized protein LOC131665289 [Phymastichus coffea]